LNRIAFSCLSFAELELTGAVECLHRRSQEKRLPPRPLIFSPQSVTELPSGKRSEGLLGWVFSPSISKIDWGPPPFCCITQVWLQPLPEPGTSGIEAGKVGSGSFVFSGTYRRREPTAVAIVERRRFLVFPAIDTANMIFYSWSPALLHWKKMTPRPFKSHSQPSSIAFLHATFPKDMHRQGEGKKWRKAHRYRAGCMGGFVTVWPLGATFQNYIEILEAGTV